ncbi:MAG: lipopolysaccharide heptosyltransferase II [Bacteroidetes bacterium]|nr:lipopolysaccharide heptosyltransferase II [Bacteroidota bacterium]
MSAFRLNKVLLIRLSSIGDIILCTPMLRAIKQAFPECEVHFLTRKEFAPLLLHDPHIDHLLSMDTEEGRTGLAAMNLALMREQYDAVFDLHNNFRSRTLRNGTSARIHHVDKRVFRRLLLVWMKWNRYGESVPVPQRYIETALRYGIRADTAGPRLYPPDESYLEVRLKLRTAGMDPSQPAKGICPGAKHATKRWPAAHYVELARRLAGDGQHLLLFGSKEDVDTAAEIKRAAPQFVHDLTGRLSLMETAAAMRHCQLIIANDSGLMHMATAMKVPVIALFGSTVREFGFFPYHSPAAVLEVDGLPCRPCTHIGRARCPEDHFACLRAIGVEDVLAAIGLLDASS